MSERKKVSYLIHHQAVADCPKCDFMHVVDLGEDDLADGVEIDCDNCEFEFELESAD